jgi:hypothetical protein
MRQELALCLWLLLPAPTDQQASEFQIDSQTYKVAYHHTFYCTTLVTEPTNTLYWRVLNLPPISFGPSWVIIKQYQLQGKVTQTQCNINHTISHAFLNMKYCNVKM